MRSEDETRLRQANMRIEDIKPEKESDNHAVIDSLVSLSFSLETAKKYKNKHGVKIIERNLAYTLAKKQEGKISDIPAYLNKAIENDYGGAWDIENKKKLEAQLKAKKEKAEKEKIEQAQQSKEEQLNQAKKIMYQDAFNKFLELPSEQQEAIKSEFMKATDSFTVIKMKESEKITKIGFILRWFHKTLRYFLSIKSITNYCYLLQKPIIYIKFILFKTPNPMIPCH